MEEITILIIGLLIGFGIGYLTGMDYDKHAKKSKNNNNDSVNN